MSGGAVLPGSLFYPQNPLGNPTNIPLGPLTPPAQDNSLSMQLVAARFNIPHADWGMSEWELAARYLAHALDKLAESEQAKSNSLLVMQLANYKRPRGRPRKGFPKTLGEALRGNPTQDQTRRPGRPRKRDFQKIIMLVDWARQEFVEANPGVRATDVAVLRHRLAIVAKDIGKSERWIREKLPKLQKDYSEAKRVIGKLNEKP